MSTMTKDALPPDIDHVKSSPLLPSEFVQTPVAIVGLSCRLPGHNLNPTALWDFLRKSGCATTEIPKSRFNFEGHNDASLKPGTMQAPGGMFIEDIDPRDIDAPFFGLSKAEALSMDPQQRQILEVVYEGLENAGISLAMLKKQSVGCFVSSYASDYGDIQSRDPEDKAPASTVGIGRAMLSNRISHFLDVHGPSMTIDTACSGGLVAADVACRYLHTREIRSAIVAGCNLYLNPDHTMDTTMKGAISVSGRCHTFDEKADGYVKSEAVNSIILRRLDDAIKDGDPIRAVIRGSATNSDGWTSGIASPSSEAQAAAIRQAYRNARIHDLGSTSYVECHGTGTPAGDPIEVAGVSSVFRSSRSAGDPLLIGSIKSNIGHSEPAAGLSGLLKTVLALENGVIPGNPTFERPNPLIDFRELRIRVSREAIRWPSVNVRRACVNSFGYGGSNASIILDEAKHHIPRTASSHISSYCASSDDIFSEDAPQTPAILVFSANDEASLKTYCEKMAKHLIDPRTNVKLSDLAYTLSERRTHHFHRAYLVARDTRLDLSSLVHGNIRPKQPSIHFIFTGQGAQWPQMGRDLIQTFPSAKKFLAELDLELQGLPDPPQWSLLAELVEPRPPEHLRQPEFSQPLVTAIQLLISDIFAKWSIRPQSVAGHSSGEIAAAASAGFLTPKQAIKVAYYRGKAASMAGKGSATGTGMLALGISTAEFHKYAFGSRVHLACINSANSITVSGRLPDLEKAKAVVQADGRFARLLRVDLAYHSEYMLAIAAHYRALLDQHDEPPSCGHADIAMFSTVTGRRITGESLDSSYWERNMVCPVLFEQAIHSMISEQGDSGLLIEIGPSRALAGPVTQILKEFKTGQSSFEYHAALERSQYAANATLDVAGRIFLLGGTVQLSRVNQNDLLSGRHPSVIVDLPNYAWNHSVKYWHESDASKDWRFRSFVRHDLLGSKILGTSWQAPSWKAKLQLQHHPWLRDHRLSGAIIFPAAGYIAMAVEALYQTVRSIGEVGDNTRIFDLGYRIRNIVFAKAMVLDESQTGLKIMTTLIRLQDSWYKFKIFSSAEGVWTEHCGGLIRLNARTNEGKHPSAVEPLEHTTSAKLWYKAMHDVGYSFGPCFQKQLKVEARAGSRQNKALLDLTEPASIYPQSLYPIHPACIDGCLQSGGPSLWQGCAAFVGALLIPASIDEVTIHPRTETLDTGISLAYAKHSGLGTPESAKNYKSYASVYDSRIKAKLIDVAGLAYHELESQNRSQADHAYTRVSWKPDISFATQTQLSNLVSSGGCDIEEKVLQPADERPVCVGANRLLDLITHKKPSLKVMEVIMFDTAESIWLDGGISDSLRRSTCRQFQLNASATTSLLNLQEKYRSSNIDMGFGLLDITKPSTDVGLDLAEYDLLIVRSPPLSSQELENLVVNSRRLLSYHGHLLLLLDAHAFGQEHESDPTVQDGSPDPATVLRANSFINRLGVQCICRERDVAHNLYYAVLSDCLPNCQIPSDKCIEIRSFSDGSIRTGGIGKALVDQGWQLSSHPLILNGVSKSGFVIVLDELFDEMLGRIDAAQWQELQDLVNQQRKILWVTTSAQYRVTEPNKALITGLLRTVRAENPDSVLATLDVDHGPSERTSATVHRVLSHLERASPDAPVESEFVEREGVIYISRIVPDHSVNRAEKIAHENSVEPRMMPFFEHQSCIRLVCPRVGNLDSLCFQEVPAVEIPLKDDHVEIDLHAAGLNFKDLATVLGIVPDDQYRLGLEGSGVVRRVGSRVQSIAVGQRVLVHGRGCFANRVQCPVQGTHLLPDSMSFEEAAALPCVWLVVLYALRHLCDIKAGERILIHSAAGGVGLAAIQFCQYIGAETYATVGTKEKKDFLMKAFNLPADRIFDSRSTDFASKLKAATKEQGVNVILNSLTGDLLDESWRCIADGGTMVEIGKADIVGRKNLSMEPFGRNASYRAVDMSHRSISHEMTARLLSEMFQLLEEGHLGRICPVKIFGFDEIPTAYRYMRQGNHIGKIIFSRDTRESLKIPVEPAMPVIRLRDDVAYLLVGGLKGLCGSLAIYMARLGARHLVAMSRSGFPHTDSKTKGVLRNLEGLGCHCEVVAGDVSIEADVRRAFELSSKPIGGIIQGAMILKDKIFTAMAVEDFHAVIRAKVAGTWNIHNVALGQKFPLEFFTMLSSISGIIGQKGQANYAAANTFLDSFAAYRQGLGLPASSVDLGVIEDVGYISEREELAQRLDTAAWTPINERLLHRILRVSILQQQSSPINPASATQTIIGIPVPQPKNSVLLRDARFSALDFAGDANVRTTNSPNGSEDVQAFHALLKADVSRSALLSGTVDIVARQFMRSLNRSEPIEPGRPLAGYGVDSLAAVEIRNWIRMDLGVEITTLEINDAASLVAVCERILAKVRPAENAR